MPKKKFTAKKRENIIKRYARDYQYLVEQLWHAQLHNLACKLGEEDDDVYEEFGIMT